MTKLKLLFCVVVGLFGAMHVGAAVGVVQDRVEKRVHLARLQEPALGFCEQDCGAWTWEFRELPQVDQKHAGDEHAPPVHGNLIAIARAIGVPFSRLRCALPEELCAGVTAHCSGNTYGMSAKNIEEHADKRLALLRRLIGDDEPGGADEPDSGKIPALMNAEPSTRRQQLERMPSKLDARSSRAVQCVTATALLFAVLSTRCLVPEGEVRAPYPHAAASYFIFRRSHAPLSLTRALGCFARAQLAVRHEEAAAFLLDSGQDPDERFFPYLAYFKCMLASDNIRRNGQWLDRARLCACARKQGLHCVLRGRCC